MEVARGGVRAKEASRCFYLPLPSIAFCRTASLKLAFVAVASVEAKGVGEGVGDLESDATLLSKLPSASVGGGILPFWIHTKALLALT